MEAPKQNWSLYHDKCRHEHAEWLRSLTPARALSLCDDLRILAGRLLSGGPDAERTNRNRWQEKLAIRRKLVAAFMALDRRRRE